MNVCCCIHQLLNGGMMRNVSVRTRINRKAPANFPEEDGSDHTTPFREAMFSPQTNYNSFDLVKIQI